MNAKKLFGDDSELNIKRIGGIGMIILIVSVRTRSNTIVTIPFTEYLAIPLHFRQKKGGGDFPVMAVSILGNSEKVTDSNI